MARSKKNTIVLVNPITDEQQVVMLGTNWRGLLFGCFVFLYKGFYELFIEFIIGQICFSMNLSLFFSRHDFFMMTPMLAVIVATNIWLFFEINKFTLSTLFRHGYTPVDDANFNKLPEFYKNKLFYACKDAINTSFTQRAENSNGTTRGSNTACVVCGHLNDPISKQPTVKCIVCDNYYCDLQTGRYCIHKHFETSSQHIIFDETANYDTVPDALIHNFTTLGLIYFKNSPGEIIRLYLADKSFFNNLDILIKRGLKRQYNYCFIVMGIIFILPIVLNWGGGIKVSSTAVVIVPTMAISIGLTALYYFVILTYLYYNINKMTIKEYIKRGYIPCRIPINKAQKIK